jgi:putative acetyltransferase
VTAVRPFRADDAPALARIFHAAVHEIASQYYSAEQVAAWSPGPPAAGWYLPRALDGRVVLVAVDDRDEPLAYGDIEADGHIDHFYCRPDAARTGVTTRLYEALETVTAELGIDRLYVEASEPARRFFERRGFEAIMRRDFLIRGVQIHNYRMEKRLGASSAELEAPAQSRPSPL